MSGAVRVERSGPVFTVPLIDGGTVRLPRLIGLSNAIDMILTGRPVDALEAQRMGLANRVVAVGQSRAAAEELALALSGFPQVTMRGALRGRRRASRGL